MELKVCILIIYPLGINLLGIYVTYTYHGVQRIVASKQYGSTRNTPRERRAERKKGSLETGFSVLNIWHALPKCDVEITFYSTRND